MAFAPAVRACPVNIHYIFYGAHYAYFLNHKKLDSSGKSIGKIRAQPPRATTTRWQKGFRRQQLCKSVVSVLHVPSPFGLSFCVFGKFWRYSSWFLTFWNYFLHRRRRPGLLLLPVCAFCWLCLPLLCSCLTINLTRPVLKKLRIIIFLCSVGRRVRGG